MERLEGMPLDYFPCVEAPDCPYKQRPSGCYEDIHHLYFPKAEYSRSSIERQFWKRHKILVCRRLHDYLQSQPPPPKPDLETMRRTLHEP